MATTELDGRRQREQEISKHSCAGDVAQVFGFKNKPPEMLLPWKFQETSFASQHGPQSPSANV